MDDYFQNILSSALHLFERLFGFFEFIPVCDEALRLHTTTSHEVDGGRIYPSLISNRSPDCEISDAGDSDREHNILRRLSAQINL